jgi:hypothetical protein
MWLTSFDVEPGWGPVEATVVGGSSIGDRKDWVVAVLDPALWDPDGSIDCVLLGARHQGESVVAPSGRWPMHVYVCAPKAGVSWSGPMKADEVSILRWGLLHETRERAEVDTY